MLHGVGGFRKRITNTFFHFLHIRSHKIEFFCKIILLG